MLLTFSSRWASLRAPLTRWAQKLALLAAVSGLAACAGESPNCTESISFDGVRGTGCASWYGPGFAGSKTANGERFDPQALTAAHRTLPFSTWVRVTNLHNGRSVVVRINDRGPFSHHRVLDLSDAAADALDMKRDGVIPVAYEVVSPQTASAAN